MVMFKKLTSVAIALICVQLTCDLESILVREVNFETGRESIRCVVLYRRVQQVYKCSAGVQQCNARGVRQVCKCMLLVQWSAGM